MVDIVSNIEWHDNMLVKEFVKENRVGGEVQSLTVKIKVYKKDAIPTTAGNNSILTYTDQSITKYIKTGKDYLNFNSATALVEKSFTYTLPNSERTSYTQTSSGVDGEGVKLSKKYFTKTRVWNTSMKALDDYATCYNSLWTDLEALDVSW